MAAAVACGSASGSWAQLKDSRRNVRNSNKDKKKGFRVCCVSSTVSYPYKTLRIQPGATESEVKKAFRQLALQIIYTKEDPDQSRGFGFVTMSTVEEAEKAIELFHQHGAPSHQHIQKGSQRFQGSLEGFL